MMGYISKIQRMAEGVFGETAETWEAIQQRTNFDHKKNPKLTEGTTSVGR